MGRSRRLAAALAGVVTAMLAGTAIVQAAPRAAVDGGDTFNVASGTSVNATTAQVVFSVPSTVPAMVVKCTASGFAGVTGTTLKFTIGLPTFNDGRSAPCTDNLGFTDTFLANSTKGAWTVMEKDFANGTTGDEGLTEPNATGDKMLIHLPMAGLTDTNNWPCNFTFAPSGAVTIGGAYNDAGRITIKAAKIPVSVSGPSFCGPASQTVALTVTYRLSRALFDQG